MSNENPESRIVQGTIAPIKASDLRFPDATESQVFEPETVNIGIGLAEVQGIHVPDVISLDPPVVGPRTIAHAVELCRGIVASIPQMPLTEQAGDTIAIALSLLHLHAACDRLVGDARAESLKSANRFGNG